MSATQPATQPKSRPYDDPRYSRTARATLAKWFMQMFPIQGVTEPLLMARRKDEAVHDLYLLVNNTLRILEAVSLAVLDNNRDMPRGQKIEEEAKIKAPRANFLDQMKNAHRADFDARQARRAETQAQKPAEERAAG